MKKESIIKIAISAGVAAGLTIGGIAFYKFYKPEEYKLAAVSKIMKDETKLVAHRGFRAIAPENTLPAYEEAGKAAFWGAECDIYRTLDGVWVTHHDPITTRMMNATKNIEKSKYSELIKYDYNNGHNIEKYPNLKICKFEDYLACCEKYRMKAVIELKGKNNLEYFDEIIKLTDSFDIEPIFISFQMPSLRKIRELKPDAKIFLVVDDIKDSDIDFALDIGDCGIDFDVDLDKNYKNDCEMIKKCTEKNIELGVWACDYPEKMQRVVDLGVKYITTDCLTEY
ncbi:MAG: hypothetical protein IKR97_08225 [Eubacterium sp.]|nr:hypothetical protein [Eubacterium sp.]